MSALIQYQMSFKLKKINNHFDSTLASLQSSHVSFHSYRKKYLVHVLSMIKGHIRTENI